MAVFPVRSTGMMAWPKGGPLSKAHKAKLRKPPGLLSLETMRLPRSTRLSPQFTIETIFNYNKRLILNPYWLIQI